MASDGDKNWSRPWSTEEIIENADNWSLAGDVALLNTIKSFADNFIKKTVSISDNVDQMLNDVNEVGLQLDIAQNTFQSLRNRQFIESRVYEDDETAVNTEEVTPIVKESIDQEKLIVQHLSNDLKLLDKYFNKVEVSISDSEDESGDISYILQAKDLYAERPLPLLIGSEEWWSNKPHVGLDDSSSESETDKVLETYSESDSADELPKDLLKGSETSSELDLSIQTSENRPVANSTFNDSIKRPDIIASEDESDQQGSIPVKAPISNNSFAEQLAARLGNVVSEREDIFAEVNRQPIQPASKFASDLFCDEPPPLDDFEDTVLPKSAHTGLFSGGQGLFDDNEEPFWGQQSQTVSKIRPENESVVEEKANVSTSQHVSKPVAVLPKSSKISKGLFDSGSESSDEDIFAANRKLLSRQPFLQPFKTTAPLFDDEPPALDDNPKPAEEVKKKPAGGVSIFGKNDILSNELLKRQENIASDEQVVKNKKFSLFDDEINTDVAASNPAQVPTKTKKVSLFDDDDDLFKDDLFSNISSKSSAGLFDAVGKGTKDLFASNESANTPEDDIFSTVRGPSKTTEVKTKTNVGLFDDKDDIFEQKSKDAGARQADVAADNSINADVEREISDMWKSEKSPISTKLTATEGPTRVLEETTGIEAQRQVVREEKKATKGLFDEDDEESEGDDFFKDIVISKPLRTVGLFEDVAGVDKDKTTTPKPDVDPQPGTPQFLVTDATPQSSNSKSVANLFGSSPPPVDEDWDTKSDNISDNEEQFSYRADEHTVGSSLFDNEPPSLGPNESSGIVRDQNITRIDTDDSSFYPYASSSRRLSSDMFNEQQSQDSFFITKSKDLSNAIPSLDIIPEVTNSTKIDITPSGDPEDFDQSEEKSSLNDTSVFQRDAETVPGSTKKHISLFEDDDAQYSDSEDLFSIKPSPKRSQTLADKVPEVKEQEPATPSTGSPGKLKHNLNINVRALMPGYVPPKLKDIPKSQSLDLPKEQAVNSVTISTPDMSFSRADTPEVAPRHSLEKAVSFEDTANNVEVLHSVTKDRARIPIKRRPSTRRGRQQAIRTSATADSLQGYTVAVDVASEDNLQRAEIVQTKTDLKAPSVETEPSSQPQVLRVGGIFDDEEDLFSNPPAKGAHRSLFDTSSSTLLDAQKQVEVISDISQQEVKTDFSKIVDVSSVEAVKENVGGSTKEDLFQEDADLFLNRPGKENKTSRADKSKSSIFDLDDSDEDLFGPSEMKSKKDSKSSGKVGKKSLFGDSSSDEDLFSGGGSSDSRRKGGEDRRAEKKPPKAQTLLKKLENIETNDDPLSSLLK